MSKYMRVQEDNKYIWGIILLVFVLVLGLGFLREVETPPKEMPAAQPLQQSSIVAAAPLVHIQAAGKNATVATIVLPIDVPAALTDPHIFAETVKQVNQSNATAQYALARYYLHENGANVRQGVDWLVAAVAQDNKDAMGALGLCYLLGKGIAQDTGQAINFLSQAVESGEPAWEYALGRAYFAANDIPQGMLWLGKAVAQNFVPAQNYLAQRYIDGATGVADSSKALELVQAAANSGYARSEELVGVAYTRLYALQPENSTYKEKAVSWLGKAVQQDLPEAQYELGRLYQQDGETEEAIHYLGAAADQNNVAAQLHLGQLLIAEQAVDDGLTLLHAAALAGNTEAMYGLANYYASAAKSDQPTYYTLGYAFLLQYMAMTEKPDAAASALQKSMAGKLQDVQKKAALQKAEQLQQELLVRMQEKQAALPLTSLFE